MDEIDQVAEARLTKRGFVVSDAQARDDLESRGYGDAGKRTLLLKDYEALYLLYTERLDIPGDNKKISFNYVVEYALKRDALAWTKFLIYRDLRSRGYVPKEGFGFGADFRVYERGDYGAKAAKFVIFGVNEGTEIPVSNLSKSVRQISRMGKVPIVAVVDRRGEVIYYRLSRANFPKIERT